MWNSAIFAVNGDRLMALFKERFLGNTLASRPRWPKQPTRSPSWALGHLYERISDVDFSRHILHLN